MDVSEIDRVEERERHNELMDMLDNVDFSDVLEDQTPSLVSLEQAAPVHAQPLRSPTATYATSEYAAKVVEFADDAGEVGQLRGVMEELHSASAKNKALSMQLEHLKLRFEGIQQENSQLHQKVERETVARESAEEQLVLVQAKLQQISAFEASAGVSTETGLEALRGQLLHHAREEIADLKLENHTLRMTVDKKTKDFDELLHRYDAETKALRTEMHKLSNDLAQRTVLYASKEREWRVQLSQNERMKVDQNAQLIALEASNKQLQRQLERLETQRDEEVAKRHEFERINSQLEEDLALVREAEQQLADDNAELRGQLVGLQNEVEHLRRGGVDDLQRNMAQEVEQLRVAHDRDVRKLQAELDQAVEAFKAEQERSVRYEQESVKYRELSEQSERALAEIINNSASSDAVIAQLLERSGRLAAVSTDQSAGARASPDTAGTPVGTSAATSRPSVENSAAQTEVDYERVIADLETELQNAHQQITALRKQLEESHNTDLRLEAHQVQLEVKYNTAMQAELARLRAELESDYASRKEQLDKARQSTLTESRILHEEIRQLRDENHALRTDYDDIRQQQQDASQIAEMIASQRVDEIQEKHVATLNKLHQQWESVLRDFAAFVAAAGEPSVVDTSTMRERLATIANAATRNQAYSLLESLSRVRAEISRRLTPKPMVDKAVVAECTAKVRVDLLRVMEPVMQMLLSHLGTREEKLMRKVGALDIKLRRCHKNVARVKAQSAVQPAREHLHLQRARHSVESMVKTCQDQLQSKLQAIGWRVDGNQKKMLQLQSTISTAQAMILARQDISEATHRTLVSRNNQLQYAVEQLEHELQAQGGFTEPDSLDFTALRAMAKQPDARLGRVALHLHAQVQELRNSLEMMSVTTEAGMKSLFAQCADQVRVVSLKYQSMLTSSSPQPQRGSPRRMSHARVESAPSEMQVHEIIEREHQRLSREFEAKQASIISHWREEMRLAVARIKAQAEADAQREYATKSEQQRIAQRAELERALSEKEQEFTRRLTKLNAEWQARFDDLDTRNAGAEEMRAHLQQQLAHERARMQESKQREMERLRQDIKAEMKARYKAKVAQLKQRFEAERDAILEMVRQECETLLQEAKFAVARRKQRATPEETPQLHPEMLSPAQTQALLDSIVRRSHQTFEKTGQYTEQTEPSDWTPYSRTAPVVTPSTTSTMGSANHRRRRPRTAGSTRVR